MSFQMFSSHQLKLWWSKTPGQADQLRDDKILRNKKKVAIIGCTKTRTTHVWFQNYFVAGASDACAGGDRLRHLLGSLADLLPCCHCSPSCKSVSGSTNKFSKIVANVNKFPAGNTSTSCSLSSTGLQWVTAATTHVFTEYTAWVLSHQTILKIIQNNPQNCENIPWKPKNHENNPKKLKIILKDLKVILKDENYHE